MKTLDRIQNTLPGPYSLAGDAVLTQFLDVTALELETFGEDLQRMRECHWIDFVYRLLDAEKLAALMGIARLPWEVLDTFRDRLVPLIRARLAGALGPNEIRQFAYDYLSRSQDVLGCTFVPGFSRMSPEQAFQRSADRVNYRPLELEENPHRLRTSASLQARSGRVPYLLRWTETNKGLDDTLIRFRITGLLGGRTVVPVLLNVTTGDLIAYAGRVGFGETLEVGAKADDDREIVATLNGADVTHRLFSVPDVEIGVSFARAEQDAKPLVPRLVRGDNDFIFLSIGLYDLRGLDHFFFAMAGKELREGVFDQSFFSEALFPSGPIANLQMEWMETEPASFELRVPRGVVVEPSELVAFSSAHPYEQFEEAMRDSVRQLHAAGVRAQVRFVPFVETQPQEIAVTLPWKVIERERGPTGVTRGADAGGRYGDTSVGTSRFE